MNESTKQHFSASQINSFYMCGEAYKRRYIDKDVRPASTRMIFGISFHKAPEVNNKQKIISRVDLKIPDLEHVVADTLTKKFSEGVELDKDEKTMGKDKVKGQLTDMLVALVPLYHTATKPIFPREVEIDQVLDHPKWTRTIKYRMDVETEDDVIIDYKTGGRLKNQSDIDQDTGLTTYSLAFMAKNRKMPANILIDNYVSYVTPKTKELKTNHAQFSTKRDPKDFQIYFKRIELIQKSIDAGIFTPAPIGHWKCNEKYCEYFQDCIFMNQERLAAGARGGDQ